MRIQKHKPLTDVCPSLEHLGACEQFGLQVLLDDPFAIALDLGGQVEPALTQNTNQTPTAFKLPSETRHDTSFRLDQIQ